MPRYLVKFKQVAFVCKAIDAASEDEASRIADELMDSDYRYDIIDSLADVSEWDYEQEVVRVMVPADDLDELIDPETVGLFVGEEGARPGWSR